MVNWSTNKYGFYKGERVFGQFGFLQLSGVMRRPKTPPIIASSSVSLTFGPWPGSGQKDLLSVSSQAEVMDQSFEKRIRDAALAFESQVRGK